MKSAVFLVSGLSVVLSLQLFAQAQKATAISARNFLWVNDEFCTAGQPSLEDLARLKAEGVKAILNLRRPGEEPILAREEERARALELKYFNIPVKTSAPQEHQADEFLRIVRDESNCPILIHCASANRVGGFWIIYRVLQDGWSFEKAEKEARRIGLRSPVLIDFARNYIEKYRQQCLLNRAG